MRVSQHHSGITLRTTGAKFLEGVEKGLFFLRVNPAESLRGSPLTASLEEFSRCRAKIIVPRRAFCCFVLSP